MAKTFYCFFTECDNLMGGATFAFGSVTDERVPSLLSRQYPAAANAESKVIHSGDWKPPEFGTLVSQSDPQGLKAYSKKKKEMYASIKTYLTQYEGVAEEDVNAALNLTEQNGIEAVIALTGKILVGVPVGFAPPRAAATQSGGNNAGNSKSGGGCYIATAVYGSYDAPQVLVLRRYRDETLTKSIVGRLFIKIYYFLSPPFASRLNNARRMNGFVRGVLDKIVFHLKHR